MFWFLLLVQLTTFCVKVGSKLTEISEMWAKLSDKAEIFKQPHHYRGLLSECLVQIQNVCIIHFNITSKLRHNMFLSGKFLISVVFILKKGWSKGKKILTYDEFQCHCHASLRQITASFLYRTLCHQLTEYFSFIFLEILTWVNANSKKQL